MEYDELDVTANRLLFRGRMPVPRKSLEPEMVEYYKTPASVVHEIARRVGFGPEDVFVDLGSGLGQVVLLLHLLTGVRARGVEIDPAFCRFGCRCAAARGFRDVDFVAADAREADLRSGTVFYLFSPFRGSILREVLDRLRALNRERPIRVLSFGPCSVEVEREEWLREMGSAEREAGKGEYVLRVFQGVAPTGLGAGVSGPAF